MINVKLKRIKEINNYQTKHAPGTVSRKYVGGFAFMAAALFASGCTQPGGTVGSGVGGGPEGTPEVIVCSVDVDTSFHAQGVGTGGSAYLYVGASNGLTSESIIRFGRPYTSPGMIVDSARIEVAYQGGIGDGAQPSVEANLVYFPWVESKVPARSDVAGGTNLTGEQVVFGDSGAYHFRLDTAEVNAWFRVVDSSRADTGWSDPQRPDTALTVVLRAPNAVDKLVRFRARSATSDSLRPYLILFATFPDSVGQDTIRIVAGADMFLPEDSNPIQAGRITIGGGAPIRTALNFQLSPLWARQTTHYVVVNRAILTLTRDRSQFGWAPLTPSVWPYQMTSKRWRTELDSSEYSGFVLVPTAVDSTIDTLQIIVSGPTVAWAKGDSTNNGLLLLSASEALDLERISFYDSNDPDTANRPRLTVYYTELPR